MPLSPPRERELLHDRRIACFGYRRADGLWDIEAHLTDVKSYPFPNRHRGTIEPGEPLHRMALRITVDDSLTIREAEAATDLAPFGLCAEITPAFAGLKDLTIGPGFRRHVRALLGGVHGCTHLVELLAPIATVAFQTVYSERARRAGQAGPPAPESGAKPGHIDTCHALASDGPVVRDHYPEWYSGR